MSKKRIISGALIVLLLLPLVLFPSVAAAESVDISVDEAYQMLQEKPEEIILLDVRTEMEYKSEHIPGAINIPLAVLESRVDELDKSKIIMVYCQAGGRSLRAKELLLQHGFERVHAIVGGLNAWKQKYPTTMETPIPTQTPIGAIQAPPFTLTSIGGPRFSLGDYQGKVVVLTLVSTWCNLCNDEMKELTKLRQAYPELTIVTVAVDPTDTNETLRSFKERYHADWLFARDTDNVFSKYTTYPAVIPTIVIITPQGEISFRKPGFVPLEELKSAVESASPRGGALTPTETPEAKPVIPGFGATSAIVIVSVLVVCRWIVRRKRY